MGKAEKLRGDSSQVVVDEALTFIRQQVDAKKPYLAVVWFGSPHAPHVGTPDDLALYADQPEKQRHFLAEITAMDRAMGQLRAGLREMGTADNTVLWYCSDNGAIPQGSTAGLRGKKGQIYEGGLRVPCLVEWPGKEPRRIDAAASTMDIYPTVLELAGAKPAQQPVLDGESLLPLLEGKTQQRTRPIGFWDSGVGGKSTPSDRILAAVAEKQEANQEVTDRAALGFPPQPLEWKTEAPFAGHSAWVDGAWKLHRIEGKNGNVRWELYNLADDPKETRDLGAEQAERTAKMRKGLEDWLASVVGSLEGKDYSGK
jgi:arylsulfatase A-like enzyme